MHETKFNSKDFSDEDLVNASTETIGAQPSQKSLWAQSELTRRLMESIKKFDKATSTYTQKLITLTILLFFVAMVQLVISTFALPFDMLNRTLIAISVGILLVWIIKDMFRKG